MALFPEFFVDLQLHFRIFLEKIWQESWFMGYYNEIIKVLVVLCCFLPTILATPVERDGGTDFFSAGKRIYYFQSLNVFEIIHVMRYKRKIINHCSRGNNNVGQFNFLDFSDLNGLLFNLFG